MKAYGVPRVRNLQWPERPEFIRFGLKKFKMTSKVKKTTRRIWKKLARRTAKKEYNGLADSISASPTLYSSAIVGRFPSLIP